MSYYLDVPRFLSQGFQAISPPRMLIAPWMWISGRVTLDFLLEHIRISRSGIMVSKATVQGAVFSVPGPAYTVPVTLDRQWQLNNHA